MLSAQGRQSLFTSSVLSNLPSDPLGLAPISPCQPVLPEGHGGPRAKLLIGGGGRWDRVGRPGSRRDSEVTPGQMLSGLGLGSGREHACIDILPHARPCPHSSVYIVSVHPQLPFERAVLMPMLKMMALRLREVRYFTRDSVHSQDKAEPRSDVNTA